MDCIHPVLTPKLLLQPGADDEYHRSIGAMFAVYWIMRIGIDGARLHLTRAERQRDVGLPCQPPLQPVRAFIRTARS